MQIKINGIIEKQSQAGKTYWEIQTNKGSMSAFDMPVVDGLREAWRTDKEIVVDAQTSKDGKYVNIRGLGLKDAVVVEKPQVFGRPDIVAKAINNPHTTMYVSYAKDIFIELIKQYGTDPAFKTDYNMGLAINLVKQAQNAFS